MIEERFIQAAIKIRRDFLKISNNMNLYHSKAREIVSTLTELQKKAGEKQELINSGKVNHKESIDILQDVIKDIEEETKRISDNLDPLNKEMELLLVEEGELWRQIKDKHSDIDESKIVEYVKERIIQAGLSK